MKTVDRAHVDWRLGVQQTLQVLPAAGGDQDDQGDAGQPVEPDGARGEPSDCAVFRAPLCAWNNARSFPIANHDAQADGEWQGSGEEEIVAQKLAPGLSSGCPLGVADALTREKQNDAQGDQECP